MSRNIKTHLYCFDDHRLFTDEIRKKFDDTSRYSVQSFQAVDEYLVKLNSEKEGRFCKIAIIGLHDTREQHEKVERLISEIKKIDARAGVILVCPPDKADDAAKKIKYNVDACIPLNSNSILRIHNSVKKLFSEYNIVILKKRRKISFLVLLAFVIFAIISLITAYLEFPKYF